MRRGVFWAACAAFLLWGALPAYSQATVRPCVTVSTALDGCKPLSASNPMPISGTITATVTSATVTGTGTAGSAAAGVLTVQGIASMTPLLAAGSGTAGTAATGVLTVQGIASMTPLLATVTGNLTTVSAVTGITNTVVTQELGASFVNITTNTDTNVKGAAGTFVGITVNTAGTTSTAKIYNDGDGTCNSGLIATVNTAVLGTDLIFNAAAGTGICVTTAGAGAADITILYR